MAASTHVGVRQQLEQLVWRHGNFHLEPGHGELRRQAHGESSWGRRARPRRGPQARLEACCGAARQALQRACRLPLPPTCLPCSTGRLYTL